MPEITYQFLVTVKTRKPVPDLIDLVAGRIHTIDNVFDSTAALIVPDTRTPAPTTREDAIERSLKMSVVATRSMS